MSVIPTLDLKDPQNLPSVTIVVCTYQRQSVFCALRSFEELEFNEAYELDIVVIDNDETNILENSIEVFAREYSLPLKYVHAPAKNISIARNAGLDSVKSKWLLFIDDDETANPSWLKEIMRVRGGCHAVIGQCQAVYTESQPEWLKKCDFHSNRLQGDVVNAYTSNALLDMDFVREHNLRFRVELGKTGGEDTVFFRQMSERGGVIKYCEEALVLENVPDSRASMSWVKTRKFRAGQTHGLLCKEFNPGAYRALLISAGCKLLVSVVMSVVTIPGTFKSRLWLARTYLHAGAFMYRIKPSIIEEYA